MSNFENSFYTKHPVGGAKKFVGQWREDCHNKENEEYHGQWIFHRIAIGIINGLVNYIEKMEK